jgi:DNA repair protein RadA/Sms
MAKRSGSASAYTCVECGASTPRWVGRCTKCGQFGTVVERRPQGSAPVVEPSRSAQPVSAISTADVVRVSSGISEFDRVVGGGLVPGQVLLLSGEPGAGKSTLLLAVAHALAANTGRTALYISGEESVDQLALRARRINAVDDRLLLAAESNLDLVLGHIHEHSAAVAIVIVDSVQTIAADDVDGRAGGISQVMQVAQALTRVAKNQGVAICLVGQVTKDSVVAGPRALEHIADTTLSLDGDRHTSLRLLRTVKNRFGPADEVACFEQSESGMREVKDPSALFRDLRESPVPGTCLAVTVEGRRSLITEIQALSADTTNPNPRRGVSGLEVSRVAMLVAVTERAAGVRLAAKDLFVATVGGLRVRDPGADLAVCLAIASAESQQPLPADVAAIGEVSLSGDVRPTPMISQRVAEAVRMGCRKVLVPCGSTVDIDSRTRSCEVVEVANLRTALRRAQ